MGLLNLFGGDSTSSSVTNQTTTTTDSNNQNYANTLSLSNVGNPTVTIRPDTSSSAFAFGNTTIAVFAVVAGLYLLTKE